MATSLVLDSGGINKYRPHVVDLSPTALCLVLTSRSDLLTSLMPDVLMAGDSTLLTRSSLYTALQNCGSPRVTNERVSTHSIQCVVMTLGLWVKGIIEIPIVAAE